ncbi:ral guanine nucleotide dissociation stimulator [Cricetulus griseus]|uniref:Ral guanine nucleotide dissociation stimulator n=1 Tax=Cricetulus griseus TaxID=10029 RepID=A0A9J7FVL1_CRIGR|nr:ral guanine nucleotide dissociation stimulator [Cricetulus griseus]XP_027269207.1 ral guanine nucleotide dissociation stimulator [Cricetulus griseus]
MFCCFQTSEGSGHQRTKRRGLGYLWRRWVRPITQYLWPLSHRETKSKRKLNKPPTFKPNSPDYLENFISYIPTAIKNQDILEIYVFLAVYPKFATAWEVLDLIMEMYGSFRPDCVEDQETNTAIFSFLSMWVHTHPQDFCDYPDVATMKRLLDYIRLNVPSSDVTIQTEDLLSVLEEQELEKDEEASDCGLLREGTPETPVLDISGMGETLPLRAASVAGPWGDMKPQDDTKLIDLEDGEPDVPEVEPVQLLPPDQPLPTSADTEKPLDVAPDVPAVEQIFVLGVVQLDCGLIRSTTSEAPMLDASGMQKTVHLRAASVAGPQGDLKPASVAGPQGDLKPQENTELMDPAVREPAVPEAESVQLLPLDQSLPASADTQKSLCVAADVPAARQVFLPAVVQLGAPEPISPLPDVDI